MDFPMDKKKKSISTKVKVITNVLDLTNSVLSKTTFGCIFVPKNAVLCAQEIKSQNAAFLQKDLRIFFISFSIFGYRHKAVQKVRIHFFLKRTKF
jgi:hypothetical protein